jgi:hypothetical protein
MPFPHSPGETHDQLEPYVIIAIAFTVIIATLLAAGLESPIGSRNWRSGYAATTQGPVQQLPKPRSG